MTVPARAQATARKATLGGDRLDVVLRWTLAGLLTAAAAWVWLTAGFFGQARLAEVAVFAIFAMAVDLLAGRVGLMSIGQAMYFGIGAYGTAVLATGYDVPAGAAMAASVAAASCAALLVGAVIVRFGDVIFILLTLAAGEMVYSVIFANEALGGSDGISGVPRMDLSPVGIDTASPAAFSAVVLALALLTFVALDLFARSPAGLLAAAIRLNPVRARALGAPLTAVRTGVYAASAALSALAGSLLGQLNGFVSPDLAGWNLSGLVLIMAIFGGLGSISGAALGAAVIHLGTQELGRHTSYWGGIAGIVFVLTVLFAENGLFALLRSAAARLARGGGRYRPVQALERAEDAGGAGGGTGKAGVAELP